MDRLSCRPPTQPPIFQHACARNITFKAHLNECHNPLHSTPCFFSTLLLNLPWWHLAPSWQCRPCAINIFGPKNARMGDKVPPKNHLRSTKSRPGWLKCLDDEISTLRILGFLVPQAQGHKIFAFGALFRKSIPFFVLVLVIF